MFSVATSEETSESARAEGCPHHGSWNRTKKFGGDVVVVHLDKDGKVKDIQPLVTGFLQDDKYVGRPDDVMLMKDGSILISDDWNGAIYRVSYGKKVAAKQ